MVKNAENRRHGAALRLRLLPEHDRIVRRAAEVAGVSLSDWMRERLLRSAREELGLKPGEKLRG